MLPSLFLSILAVTAQAEETTASYYSSTEVAKHSTLFAQAAEASAPQYSQAETNIRKYSQTLTEMDFTTAFLQDEQLSEWFTYNQKRIIGYRLQISRHVSLMTDDYDKEFRSAVDRALETFDQTVKKCDGNKMQAMMGTAPRCEGTSLDTDIAKLIDQDQSLRTALEEINALDWPEPQIEPKKQSITPITGSTYYIDLNAFSQHFLQENIAAHSSWLEQQTDSIIEGLEAGEQNAIKQAEAFRQAYRERIATDGEEIRKQLVVYANKRVKKNDKLGSIGFCGNVQALGGCSGENVTEEMISFMEKDRKFAKLRKRISP